MCLDIKNIPHLSMGSIKAPLAEEASALTYTHEL